MSAIKEILARCILDAEFLEQLKSDPDVALGNYDLTDRHRDILRSRGVRILDLLGEANQQDEYTSPELPQSGDRQAVEASFADEAIESNSGAGMSVASAGKPVAMKPTELALRLIPYASRASGDPNSTIQLTYATHVDPLPENGSLEDLPPPPQENDYGLALPTLAIQISIQPYVVQDEDGSSISFELKATNPLGPDQNRVEPKVLSEAAATRKSLSDAAAAVRSAPRKQRVDRILELISVITVWKSQMGNQS